MNAHRPYLSAPATGRRLRPGLAESWQPLSATTWRFTLRRNVLFHNGKPLTASTVLPVLTMAAQRQDPIRGLEADSARAVDDRVIEIHLSVPNQRLPEQLANPSLAIPYPGTIADRGDAPETTPTGTGPFRFASYDAGALRVEAFPQYWDGPPDLRSITFRFAPPAEAARLLASGEVDAVLPAAVTDRPAPARLVVSDPARAAYLLLNAQGAGDFSALSDDALRRAVALAVDRDGFAKATNVASARANPTLVPPLLLGRSDRDVNPPAFDPAAARKVLDDAGWAAGADGMRAKDGRALTLSLLVANGGGGVAVAAGDQADADVAALEANLKAVGIGLVRQDTAGALALQLVNQGRFDLYLETRLQEDANPCALCRLFANRPGGLLAVSSSASGGSQADALFERAFSASDDADVEQAAADLLHVVTAVRYVAVPLAMSGTSWLVAPRVRNFVPAPVPGAQAWQKVFVVR